MFEVPATLPGQSFVQVSVWDEDPLTRDDYVGATKIDIAKRWYSPNWRSLSVKPIETRALWSPVSSNPQGSLEMWVDILTEEEAARTPPIKIGPPPPLTFELRVIVWNTDEVKFRDKRMSDIFLIGTIPGCELQRTDVHWRSEDGKGAFNWRFVFPVTLPMRVPRLTLQVWDKDMLSPNDVVAEANVNLSSLFRRAYRGNATVSLVKQWVTLGHPNYEGPQGRVEVSIDLVNHEEAVRSPVGKGRDPPQSLPPPVRPDTSFNPFRVDKMITKVIWRNHKGKIIIGIVILVIILILIIVLLLKFLVNLF